MNPDTLFGALYALSILALAVLVPLLTRSLGRSRAEGREPSPWCKPLEAPAKDPERLHFEESVQRMLTRYRGVDLLDRSRLAGEIEHHWNHYLAGTCSWAVAFASVEAWVRRHTQIDKPLSARSIQTLRDPRTGARAQALTPAELDIPATPKAS